ncbi:MAG: MarR family transcriptional regulator [Acidobacteria bacterium]|nr:MarR family transcriptional regulator [Acidobacteriota bacterium]
MARTAGKLGSGVGGSRRRSAEARARYEVFAEILQAAEEMQRRFTELFRRVDLSLAQYNVLRVLRGAGPAGLTCGQVGDRLMQHDPDVTRLLDRLARRALIARVREAADRRIVRTTITPSGVAMLADLDAPVEALHEAQLGHLTTRQLEELAAAVAAARHAPPVG